MPFDELLEKELNMKFDVVIMNPPYQSASGNKGSNNILWSKFVTQGIDLVVNDGHFMAIHPSAWRNVVPTNATKSHANAAIKIFNQQILYLEIHGVDDGLKTFGCGTRYDWYVVKKTSEDISTVIVDQNGKTLSLNLKNTVFLPNFKIEEILSMLAGEKEEKTEVICNSAYHTYNNHSEGTIVKIKDKTHKYPVVNSVSLDNVPTVLWSDFNNRGHFGIPKVIFGNGSTGFFVDSEGKYGMTQWTKAIVDKKQNVKNIAKALASEKFQEIIKAIAVCSYETNHFALSLFRKDFWKEFV